MVICLDLDVNDCILSRWCHCHPFISSSLALLKCRLV